MRRRERKQEALGCVLVDIFKYSNSEIFYMGIWKFLIHFEYLSTNCLLKQQLLIMAQVCFLYRSCVFPSTSPTHSATKEVTHLVQNRRQRFLATRFGLHRLRSLGFHFSRLRCKRFSHSRLAHNKFSRRK